MLTDALELPPRPASVPQARRFVMRCLERWGMDHLCETAALLTSEIVSNAVLHARSEVVLRLAVLGASLEVRVSDRSPVRPVQRRPGDASTTGRGIALLDRLAEEWEVVPQQDGKTIRFVVAGDTDPWAPYLDSAWRDQDA